MIPRIPGRPPRDLSRPLEEVELLLGQEAHGERLDVALALALPWRSRASVQRLIAERRVLLEGREARASTRVQAGELVRVLLPPRESPPPSEAGPDLEPLLAVLHEEHWFLALDKPAGMPVHPAGRHLEGTVIHALHRRYRRPEDPAADVVPRLLHRLDRETSGLLLASKDPHFHYQVGHQFETRRVRKVYLAVVEGCPPREEGMVEAPIAPASRSAVRIRMEARHDGRGLEARTSYRILRRAGRFSLLEVVPHTGRQHQIRVHLASLGHPVVGDKIYGPDERYFLQATLRPPEPLDTEAMERLVLPRHALHSHALTFLHPRTGEESTLAAPLPPDLAGLVGLPGPERRDATQAGSPPCSV